MTKGATKSRTQRYTQRPVVPVRLRERYVRVISALAGLETITSSGASLGLSRVQMQTLVHRAEAGVIAALEPRRPGKVPSRSAAERALAKENARLLRTIARLELHAATLERAAQAWSETSRAKESSPRARGRRSRSSRSGSATATATSTSRSTKASAETEREKRLERAAELRRNGVRAETAARLVGSSASTLRRQRRACERLVVVRDRQRDACAVSAERESTAKALVRQTGGRIGADALRVATGLSRREAMRVKANEVGCQRRIEHASRERIEIAVGVVRGFDAMYVPTRSGMTYLLVACDAGVPYRTSLVLADRYDGASVLAAIEADIEEHGAPLVWRMDLASVHRTPEVRALLASREVLVLHGPPRCARFYGQLERQNRDHRALLGTLGTLPTREAVAAYVPEMKRVLNELWPRRSLGWDVPAGVWTRRPAPSENRASLHAEVQQRAARIAVRMRGGRSAADLANRIAIEEALIERGYLRRPAETVLIDVAP